MEFVLCLFNKNPIMLFFVVNIIAVSQLLTLFVSEKIYILELLIKKYIFRFAFEYQQEVLLNCALS